MEYLTNYLIGFSSKLLEAAGCAARLDEVGNAMATALFPLHRRVTLALSVA